MKLFFRLSPSLSAIAAIAFLFLQAMYMLVNPTMEQMTMRPTDTSTASPIVKSKSSTLKREASYHGLSKSTHLPSQLILMLGSFLHSYSGWSGFVVTDSQYFLSEVKEQSKLDGWVGVVGATGTTTVGLGGAGGVGFTGISLAGVGFTGTGFTGIITGVGLTGTGLIGTTDGLGFTGIKGLTGTTAGAGFTGTGLTGTTAGAGFTGTGLMGTTAGVGFTGTRGFTGVGFGTG
jgi:hypothetical protein